MLSRSNNLMKRFKCLPCSLQNWRHVFSSAPVCLPRSYIHLARFSQHASPINQSLLHHQVQNHFTQLYNPSLGNISGASELSANSKTSIIAFTGSIFESLDSGFKTRICTADYTNGERNIISCGAGSDKSPRWSPDGQRLAFISDRDERNVFQVYMLDRTRMTEAALICPISGNVESISWSSDSERLLILAADPGAEQAGAYGGARSRSNQQQDSRLEWMPSVESSQKPEGWRRAWSYDMKTGKVERVGGSKINFWEACWLDQTHVLAIISYDPTENAWYQASLATVHVHTGKHRRIYRTHRQLGVPTTSPSGLHAAVIECISSDRGGIAGDVILFDTTNMQHNRLDLNGVDVTQIMWHTNTHLSYIGLRNTSTVAGRFCLATGVVEEHWNSPRTCGALYPEATITAEGSFALVSESWNECQELAHVRPGRCEAITSFEHAGTEWLRSQMGEIKSVSWQSTDGLEIQGYLCLPSKPRKQRPLVLNVHGGPVYTFRNKWQLASPIIPLLVSRGYAVLSANPRGSTGRGQNFCAKVLQDLGGGDAQDLLSGVDAMVQQGEADAGRIGIMGVSYGGYMATWLPTQSSKFAAAVAIAPVTHWCSNHGTANIGHFDKLFFEESPYEAAGLYHARSPVMFAGTHPTPFLQITGAKDRCVPLSQSIEYHTALSEAGVNSVLVTYPNEGHGIRQQPAYRDFCARTIAWFDEHLRK